MNIAMFTDAYWPRVNGVSVSIESFSRALIRAGHKVVIVTAEYPYGIGVPPHTANPQHFLGVDDEPELFRVPSRGVLMSKEDRLAKSHSWFRVAKKMHAFKPDIIHVHTEFSIGIFGLNYAALYGVPVVYTMHTMWEEYIGNYIPLLPKWLLRIIARIILKATIARVDGVIAPSPQLKEIILSYRAKKPIWSVPTGIDPRIFTVRERDKKAYYKNLLKTYPKLTEKRILLFAGRITEEKNISFLIDTFALIQSKHPDTMLFFAGDGPQADLYREEVQEKGLEEVCIFAGYLERRELALLYALATVFVFPSCTETQGLVTIEAMLSGLPVVAVGKMGTLNVMGGDNGGFMVKNNVKEFADRVCQLLENPRLHRAKSREAKIHAQDWTIDSMTKRLEAVYTELRSSYSSTRRKSLKPR